MIKILKDVCVLQPDFPKITDIYVRILRRISDEEAIKVRKDRDQKMVVGGGVGEVSVQVKNGRGFWCMYVCV